MKILIFTILILVIIFFVKKFTDKFKVPKVGSLIMVDGGIKCGKSTMAVHIALREYKRRTRTIKIRNYFRKLFKKPLYELPLIYSNIPLAMPYVKLTTKILKREERVVFGSVVLLDEASLIADSMLIKDKLLNDELMLFFKLFGHSSHNGCCIVNSHSTSDLHFSIKRVLSNYLYVYHTYKWIPFLLVSKVQDCRYSDDGSVIQNNDNDIELNLRTVIFPKSTWRKFDSLAFSSLTDDLPVSKKIINNDKRTKNLKVDEIISFKDYSHLDKRNKYKGGTSNDSNGENV